MKLTTYLFCLAILLLAASSLAAMGEEDFLAAGKVAFTNGDHNLAVQEFKKAIQRHPKHGNAYLWLARALGRKAEKVNPLHAAFMVGEIKEAFETAVQLNPENLDAHADLLEFYLEAPTMFGGGVHKAREQARALAKLSVAEGYVAESRIAEKKKDLTEAERYLLAAQAAEPKNPGAWRELGLFYHRHKRWPQMENAFQKAGDNKARYYLAEGLLEQGQKLDEAEKLLRQFLAATVPALGDEPTRSQARLLLGQIEAHMGRPADAEREYRATLQENPNFLAAQKELERLKP